MRKTFWFCRIYDSGQFQVFRNRKLVAVGKRGRTSVTFYAKLKESDMHSVFNFQEYCELKPRGDYWLNDVPQRAVATGTDIEPTFYL